MAESPYEELPQEDQELLYEALDCISKHDHIINILTDMSKQELKSLLIEAKGGENGNGSPL